MNWLGDAVPVELIPPDPTGWPTPPELLSVTKSAFGSYQNSHSLKWVFFFQVRIASLGLVLSTPIIPPPPNVWPPLPPKPEVELLPEAEFGSVPVPVLEPPVPVPEELPEFGSVPELPLPFEVVPMPELPPIELPPSELPPMELPPIELPPNPPPAELLPNELGVTELPTPPGPTPASVDPPVPPMGCPKNPYEGVLFSPKWIRCHSSLPVMGSL